MKYVLYSSAYTGNRPGHGVKRMEFDGNTLKEAGNYGPAVNPSYLLPEQEFLYGVEETGDGAAILKYPLAGGEGKRYPVPGAGLCHLVRCGNCLYASGYTGGCLTGLREETGETVCFLKHEGRGANPARQEAPHVHSATPSPDGRHLFVADLGLDRLYQYDVQEDGGLAGHAAQPWVAVGPGQGPRHFLFHPSGSWLYLVTALDRSLLVYQYEAAASVLSFAGEYSLSEEGCPPGALAADIHITGNGRYLYASVRGEDRIVCFRVLAEGGRLSKVGSYPCGGQGPRSFDLSPDEKYLAVANQQSGTVSVFPLDALSGALGASVAQAEFPSVSCVKWQRA